MPLAKINNCGVGVNLDLSPEELGAGYWSDASNIRFRNGYAETFGGTSQSVAVTYVPRFMGCYSTSATNRILIYSDDVGIYYAAGMPMDITGNAGTASGVGQRWTGAEFNGFYIMSNGVYRPAFTTLGGDFEPITGIDVTTVPKVVRPFKNFLIGLYWGTNKSQVLWSSAAEPGTMPASWDVTDLTVDTGTVDLADTPDALVDACQLGDVLIIYKERSMYAMTYIGSPYIFRFQRLPGNDGLRSVNCVVNTPVGHVFVSQNDIMVHNGMGATSISNSVVRQYIADNCNPDTSAYTHIVANHNNSEVWVFIPTGSGDTSESDFCADTALIWNWVDKTWSIKTVDNVMSATFDHWETVINTGRKTVQDYLITGNYRVDGTGNYGAIDNIDSSADTPDDASMTRTAMHFDTPDQVKTIRSVYPKIDGTKGDSISIQVGAAMLPDETPVWGTAQTFVIGSGQKVDSFVSGRYLAVKFSSSGVHHWRMRSFEIEYVLGGRY